MFYISLSKTLYHYIIYILYLCSKQVKSFRVHCLFADQFNTEDYVTFTDVKYSIGGSTSCSSRIICITVEPQRVVTKICYEGVLSVN